MSEQTNTELDFTKATIGSTAKIFKDVALADPGQAASILVGYAKQMAREKGRNMTKTDFIDALRNIGHGYNQATLFSSPDCYNELMLRYPCEAKAIAIAAQHCGFDI